MRNRLWLCGVTALMWETLAGGVALADEPSWQRWVDCAVEGSPDVVRAVRLVASDQQAASGWERAEIRSSVEIAAGAGLNDGSPRGGVSVGTEIRDEIADDDRDDFADALVDASNSNVRWARALATAHLVREAVSWSAASETVVLASDAMALFDAELSRLEAGATTGVTEQLAMELLRVMRAEAAARLELASIEREASAARLMSLSSCDAAVPPVLPDRDSLIMWSSELISASHAVSLSSANTLVTEAAMTTSGARVDFSVGGQWEVEPEHAALLTFGAEFGERRRARVTSDALMARADVVSELAAVERERTTEALERVAALIRPYPSLPSSDVEATLAAAVGTGLLAPIEAARLQQSLLQAHLDFIELREQSAALLLDFVLSEVQP